MNYFIIILSTISSKKEALEIAEELIQNKLAACINIIEGLTSVYKWEDKLCKENEYLMIIKSRKILYEKITEKINLLHPYEVPEIISIPITDGLDSYLKWIKNNTRI